MPPTPYFTSNPIRSRPIPSFPRKRESTPHLIATPGITGVLDSGRRRNDGGASALPGVGRRRTTLPHPTLSRWERARGLRQRPGVRRHSASPTVIPHPATVIPSAPTVIPAQAGIQNPG